MALAGRGAILIWNDIASEGRDDFYDWHMREHIPERIDVPGFHRGSRLIATSRDTMPEFLTLYEISDPSIATSAPYLARLNAPTDWTKRATAHFRNTARALTDVVLDEGQGSGGMMATIRFEDTERGREAFARVRAIRSALVDTAKLPRICGVQLCTTNNAASAVRTAESRDRADIMPAPIGAILIEGCDEMALRTAVAHVLKQCGIESGGLPVGIYRLEHVRQRIAAEKPA